MLERMTLARCAAVGLSLVAAAPAMAAEGDIPEAVRNACRDDYIRHCKAHEPGSGAGRNCMADAFERLSEPCISAILDSDLVSDAAAEPSKPPERAVAAADPSRTTSKAHTAKHSKRYAARRSYAHKGKISRVANRIERGLKIADRAVSRAFRRAFR